MYRYFKYLPFVLVITLWLIPDLSIAQGFGGFVTCEGSSCSACHLVDMANIIIKWILGMVFLVFAVLMVHAGFGLVTSGGNPSALSAAKAKLTNALVGIVIVFSAWLIVNTIMVKLVSDGTTPGNITGWGPWSQVECSDQTSTIAGVFSTSTTPIPPGPAPAATGIQARIAVAANAAFQTMSTASHMPGNGRLACAWAVNKILNNAGLASIDTDSVVSMKSALNGGRGGVIAQSSTVPGDLVLVTGARTSSSNNANHVGICMNNGCTTVYSNSSRGQSFSWRSQPTFAPSYINAQPVFYRVMN